MAALLLSIAGAAGGSALFGSAGAIAGRLIGALAGNAIDQALFGGRTISSESPRLADLDVMASTAGAPIPRLCFLECPLRVRSRHQACPLRSPLLTQSGH